MWSGATSLLSYDSVGTVYILPKPVLPDSLNQEKRRKYQNLFSSCELIIYDSVKFQENSVPARLMPGHVDCNINTNRLFGYTIQSPYIQGTLFEFEKNAGSCDRRWFRNR